MNPLVTLLSVLTMTVALGLTLPVCVEVYRCFRRAKLVECPATGRQGIVSVVPWLAAISSALFPAWLRVRGCSLWADCGSCKSECLNQIRKLHCHL